MEERIYDGVSLAIVVLVLLYLFSHKIRNSDLWKATVTPLASIIGSGFLISAPLLLQTTGPWATLVMLVIVSIAYGIGSSIRFNIKHIEPISNNKSYAFHWGIKLDALSKPVLGIAYLISVAFYLQLLSAFALQGMHIHNETLENSLTTSILIFIGTFGYLKGLSMLEILETFSVNIKLSIIGALIGCFLVYNVQLLSVGEWQIHVKSHDSLWYGFRSVLGMLIIVQGFETSRYLGEKYTPELRIKTMQYAQYITAIIYIIFVGLTSVIFKHINEISETTIIDLSRVVSYLLSILLIVAAVFSQFSAAISDTLGGGGLISEGVKNKINSNKAYAIISVLAIMLTWVTNIYEIITIASKAFALYYAMQIYISLFYLFTQPSQITHKFFYGVLFSLLLFIMILVLFLGIPIE